MLVLQVLETERLAQMCPMVWHAENFFQESNQINQFFITILSHICLNRNAIVYLISERNYWIVNQYNVLKITILNYPQVFYVDAWSGINAMLSVKSVLNNFLFRIEKVQTSIGIVLGSSSENAYFIIFSKIIQTHI